MIENYLFLLIFTAEELPVNEIFYNSNVTTTRKNQISFPSLEALKNAFLYACLRSQKQKIEPNERIHWFGRPIFFLFDSVWISGRFFSTVVGRRWDQEVKKLREVGKAALPDPSCTDASWCWKSIMNLSNMQTYVKQSLLVLRLNFHFQRGVERLTRMFLQSVKMWKLTIIIN